MSIRSLLISFAAACVLAACEVPAPTPAPTEGTERSTARNFLVAAGLYGDPVFDRDVRTFARAYETGYGRPADQSLYGFAGSGLAEPTWETLNAEMARMAAQAVDGQDVVVVMLTTHGSPEVLAVRPDPDGPIFNLGAQDLSDLLAPLSNDLQVIILQACYSGSLIDDLRSPNRIILTAAAADRTSFGCNPDNDNTFFIRALNQALTQGGPWSSVFATTQGLVRQFETEVGIPASGQSLPQSSVGRNMTALWGSTGS